jgi:predicted branched-subunit amino acid permease
MDLLEAVQIAGLAIEVGAAAFLVWILSKTIKQAGGQYGRTADPRDGWRLDLFMGIVWSGMLLVQLPSIIRHLPPPAAYHLSWLSLSSIAGVMLICGGFAGRLLLRLEMRRYEQKREERMNEAQSAGAARRQT